MPKLEYSLSLIKHLIISLKKIILMFLLFLPDYNYNTIILFLRVKSWPNFKKPRSFNEKIVFMKLFRRNPLKKMVTDRIHARKYVFKKTKKCKFPKILWIGNYLTNKEWKNLPPKFVIKASHGSGMTKIIDKKKYNMILLNQIIRNWLIIDYSINKDYLYRNLPRKAIIEECLLNQNGDIPFDYKFFCFNGHVKMIQVDLDRFESHRRNLYSRNFKKLNVELFYKSGKDIPKPINLSDAIKASEEISRDFDFIRVDLYLMSDGIYFGELTCHPGGGLENFSLSKFDLLLGKYLNIN